MYSTLQYSPRVREGEAVLKGIKEHDWENQDQQPPFP